MGKKILEMRDIVKIFPGTKALDLVNIELFEGEVLAIIGENGAGKSTLMKVLMGVVRADSGKILLDDKLIENLSPYDALKRGIGMVPQELDLIPELTVAENIMLGGYETRKGIIDWQTIKEKAQHELEILQAKIDVNEKVKNLSAAYQQQVLIARTLVSGSRIIIFDEPSAALTHKETENLFNNIRALKESGKSIIIITHHLDEVVEISDRVTIMRDGKVVKSCDTNSLTVDEMIFFMANKKVEKQIHVKRNISNEILLSAKNYSRKGEFNHVSFDVHKGEILGFAGLVGAGRTELINCIYGLSKKDSGNLLYKGKEVEFTNPSQAIEAGIGLVPEERRLDGIFDELSIYENIMLPSYGKFQKSHLINYLSVKLRARDEIAKLNIKTPNELVPIKSLSGGNQQKTIIARWLEKNIALLMLDEPTRGIDVQAKSEIYKLVRQFADTGKTVIIVSSEIEELLTVADRILIMHSGIVKGEIIPDENSTREDVLKIAL